MFTAEDRDRVQAHLVAAAERDPRVTAAALVGSSATGGDRWSDLDLTLGVADEAKVDDVLADWTVDVECELQARRLFDLAFGPSIYRVFLLPGCLQVDLSLTPASLFGATTERFNLLFGEAVERERVSPLDQAHTFGLGVHHAVRAWICLERGRPWQAEYWLSSLRDEALALACFRCGLPAAYARGVDALPADMLTRFRAALPPSLEAADLRRALSVAVELLLLEGGELAAPLADDLRSLQ
jgi:hypothetical protein